jgi:hypothetical protein
MSVHRGQAVSGKDMRSAPLVTTELLAYLEETFPNKCPDVNVPIDEVRALAGVQRVVSHLQRVYRDQNKKALMGGPNAVVLRKEE